MSDPSLLTEFVEMALRAVRREYPVALIATLERPEDLGLPRQLTPAFCGSYDWHSAVHGHWCLARAARLQPKASWAERCRTTLAESLTPANLAAELAFVERRPGFERPYGLAWLLQLAVELRGMAHPPAAAWGQSLRPLENLAARRLVEWAEKLPWPVRSGEHGQSAFALGLALDWARDAGRLDERARLAGAVLRLYGADRAAPVAFEPSAHDFLSPVLAEADVLRRVMPPDDFGEWLGEFLPGSGDESLGRWLTPVTPPDRADGKFAHLDGLNLSRAWMLEGITAALHDSHELRAPLAQAAGVHSAAGLEGARGDDWMGAHWLASFAVYLLTRRGVS